MKELIERLRNDCYQEDEVRQHAKEAADALERLTAERDALKRGIECYTVELADDVKQIEKLTAERDAAKEKIDTLWIQSADRAAKIDRLTAELADVTSMYNRCVDDVHAARVERNSLREGLDGWHARYLDCEVELAEMDDAIGEKHD